MAATVKLHIIYYSAYGHVAALARKQKEGVDSVSGCEGILFQVKETLPTEAVAKMRIPTQVRAYMQPSDIPFADVKRLCEADGFLFGFPTRFGSMPGQFKSFWDATGSLWANGTLNKKPFGIFTSTNTQGGGQETTVLTSLSNFIHHGMIFVSPAYTYGPSLFSLSEVRGGSAWGAGTFGGIDNSRKPTKAELEFAKYQGRFTAEVVKKLSRK